MTTDDQQLTQQKRRKVDGAAGGSEDKGAMTRIYTEVNSLKSDVGELWNTYFVDPVSKTVCPLFLLGWTAYECLPRYRTIRTISSSSSDPSA